MEMLPEHLKGQSLYDRSYQKRTDALTAAAADPKWAETWQELGQGSRRWRDSPDLFDSVATWCARFAVVARSENTPSLQRRTEARWK